MCGIVAYIGSRPAKPFLLEGLKRLEYRGYDSAGIAVVDEKLNVARAVGRVAINAAAACSMATASPADSRAARAIP